VTALSGIEAALFLARSSKAKPQRLGLGILKNLSTLTENQVCEFWLFDWFTFHSQCSYAIYIRNNKV
jgi:hypothetical protein